MDITPTVEPKSDQLNFDDVATHPLTITITEVKKGSPEQPVELHSAEFPGRPYKPGKSMRRVLIAAWGAEAADYVGRRITLYGDPAVKFGKDAVGGIRISHLSNLSEPLTVALTVTRGKRAPFVVAPIADTDRALEAIARADSVEQLDKIAAHAQRVGLDVAEAVAARRAELSTSDKPDGESWPVAEVPA